MNAKRQSHDRQRRSQARPRPRLRIRLLVAFLSPLVFLLLVEAGLRIVGYGRPGTFLVPWTSHGQTVHLANRDYCQHFVSESLSREPESMILRRKGPSVVRVFVLGGSAAFGDPDPAYGFCRQLEVLLNAHTETKTFEVVNAAVTSMNSHVARRIAADCTEHNPDAFLIYMGNNEVVGPYGPPTLPPALYNSGRFIDLCIAAKKESRLGQLIDRSAQALRASGRPQPRWMGMEAFLATQITRDDPRMAACHRHFRDNLRDIVHTAQSTGAASILCTVPTNIRSCPPFASVHDPELSDAQLEEWKLLFDQGRAFENAGDLEQALERYRQAAGIDDAYANLAFCQARCLHGLNRIDEAKRFFLEARDLDTLRFRADGAINEVIRETARSLDGQGAVLCDLEACLEEQAEDGLVGERLLADHVHLNFRGAFLAAMAAMETLRKALPEAELKAVTASRDELFSLCRNRLLYDDREAYRLGMVMYRRKTLPPFADQIDHDSELSRLRGNLLTVYAQLKSRDLPESWYQAAAEAAPLDPYVNVRYGRYLLAQGRVGDAIRGYQQVLAAEPFNAPVRAGLAEALADGGMKDKAVQALVSPPGPYALTRREALLTLGTYYVTNSRTAEARAVYQELYEIDPDNIDVLVNLAAGALDAGKLEETKAYLDRALQTAPNSAQAMINMGNYHAKRAEPDVARTWFTKALTVEPYHYLAHVGVGIQSIRLKETAQGLEHIKKAIVLKPDFAVGYQLLAEAYQQLGQPEVARRFAELGDLFRPHPNRGEPSASQR